MVLAVSGMELRFVKRKPNHSQPEPALIQPRPAMEARSLCYNREGPRIVALIGQGLIAWRDTRLKG